MFDTSQSKRLHSFCVVSFATFCVAAEIASGRYLEVVHDTETKAGRLIEDTYDWYAPANDIRCGIPGRIGVTSSAEEKWLPEAPSKRASMGRNQA